MPSGYDVAQVCLNGHIVNSASRSFPQNNQSFCEKCGEPVIDSCRKCNTTIRGYLHIEGAAGFGGMHSPPAFCYQCGESFPWTALRLEAAKQLASEAEYLTPEEREDLSRSFDNLIRETPMTPVAISRSKRLLAKAGKTVGSAIKDILVDIVSEAVRKQMWPAP